MSNHKSVAFFAAFCGFVCLPTISAAQPFWSQYGKDAQHTAASTTGVQALNAVLWQTPVDLYPVGDQNGEDVLAHYGSPLVTLGGTVVVNVRTGPNNSFPSVDDTYRLEGHDLGTGVTNWTENTDFVDWMPHDWTPSYSSAIDSADHLYFPGAGGTVYRRSSADAATATVSQFCFYGLSNYQSDTSDYNANIQVCTPLAIDANNNVYFGFYVAGGFSNPLGLTSGIAKISSTGVGTWVTADSASGFTGQEVATNCAPAVTADGAYVYVVVKQQGNTANPVMLRLNTSNLSTASSVVLTSPPDSTGNATFPYVLDDGTASPTIGPDGDVYFGIWWSDLESRGFMLHYSADLGTVKPAGAFGWDDTASIVPASAVPSYKGTSSYLILTKYNNYSDAGLTPKPGDGENRVALLDPNATENYTVQYDDGTTGPTYQTMKEVLTVVGVTANTGQPGVREWCINMAAIDVLGKAAVVNSEDGNCYRWDFTSNTLTQVQDLQPPTGEAYTPTVVSANGISFAINNAVLYAMWDGAKPSTLSFATQTISGGTPDQATLTLSSPATGGGATVRLTSNNTNLTVPYSVFIPAGQTSVKFNISATQQNSSESAIVTADRFGYETSATITIGGSGLYAFVTSSNTLYGNQTATGDVALSGPAPAGGRTITFSSSLSSISFSPAKVVIASGYDYASFKFTAAPVAATVTGTIIATLDNGGRGTISVTNHAALLTSVKLAETDIPGGSSDVLSLTTEDAIPASGINVAMKYSAHTGGPATINIKDDGTTTQTITSTAVANSVSETITATYDGKATAIPITLSPPITLKALTLSASSVFETDAVTGTVTTASPATGTTSLMATSSSSELAIASQPVVAAGKSSATFKIISGQLSSATAQSDTVSVQFGSQTLTQTLQVKPITVTSLTLSSPTVKEGQTTTLTIHVSAPVNSQRFYCAVGIKSSLLTGKTTAYFNPNASTTTVLLTAAKTVSANTVVPVTVTLRGVTTTIDVTVEP